MRKAVVTLIQNQNGEILLLKRPATHQYPDEWCFPGGKVDQVKERVQRPNNPDAWMKVERYEEYAEAAFRETMEETGIELMSFTESADWLADKKFIVKVFHAYVLSPTVTKEFPNREHTTYGWFKGEFPIKCGRLTRAQIERDFHKGWIKGKNNYNSVLEPYQPLTFNLEI